MLKSPDAIARSTTFDDVISDQSMYRAWLASKGVSTVDSDETRIAWKMAKIVKATPNAVIKALRGQQSQPGLVERLQRIIEANPSITFEADATGVQRAVFVAPV